MESTAIRLNRIFMILLILLAGFVIYSFLFGKLFPYSPVFVGFSQHELSNTIVYIQNGAVFSDFERINALVPGVEAFHHMTFKHKPSLFIFRDRSSYTRRSLSQSRFFTNINGTIFITPWAMKEAENGQISLEIYLKHELSHSLLYQHSGILRGFQLPSWLLEGVAVYSADQMGTTVYPTKEDTYQIIRQGYFMSPNDYGTNKEDGVALNIENRIGFIYSEFACIVEYLIHRGGQETFITYLKDLIKRGNTYSIFKEHYEIEFDAFIDEFVTYVQRGSNKLVGS